MCGIFAIAHRGRPIDEAAMRVAVAGMAHRGPDAQGIVLRQVGEGEAAVHIGLGHRRLAILDLDPRSNQPFVRAGASTVFNGEIFNFAALRADYASRTSFSTTGDTEVLAEAVRLDGAGAAARFSGQWAFVQHREGDPALALGRDTFGKKPLFVYQDADTFIASSTVRAIFDYLGRAPEFDRDFLRRFFFHALAPCGERGTPFTGVGQVAPGHAARFCLRTWTLAQMPTFDRGQHGQPADEAGLAAQVQAAVERRLVSDRPLGLLLSGGVDSTLILAVLRATGRLDEVTCFIGDTGVSQDAAFATEAAGMVGARTRRVDIDYEHAAFAAFLQSCHHQERPFRLQGNLLAIPQLYAAVAQTDIKVVLDGTGADELFGGYWDRYFPFAIRAALARGEPGWLLRTLAANRAEPRRMAFALRVAARGHYDWVDPQIRDYAARVGYRRDGEAPDPLARIHADFAGALATDIFSGRLQDWLWQNDRNAMMHGVEARSPFMDRDFYPQVFSGHAAKFVGAFNKHELRRLFARFAPLRSAWRRQKQGFRWSAARFLDQNRERVRELCGQSAVLDEVFPELRRQVVDGPSPATEVREKLLAIAGVEAALGAR